MDFRAAVLHEVGRPLVVERVTAGAPEPHDVLVQLHASGLCHTDLEVKGVSQPVAFRWGALMGEKRLIRSSYGGARPRRDFPWLARAYFEGCLKLDELITQRLRLEQVNEGFGGMAKGDVVRAVLLLD